MLKTMTLGPYQAHCYVLYNSLLQEAILIDPGDNPGKIIRFLNDQSLILKAILLTHGHIDHIAAIPFIRQQYPSVPIYIHEEDYQYLLNPELNLSVLQGNSFIFEGEIIKVNDGSQIKEIGYTFTYLHFPGHTPGSSMIQVEPTHYLFSGDVLFKGSIGRYDFPLSSISDTKLSISRMKRLDPSFKVYPGHGEFTTIDDELQHNPFFG